jgi:23S rRNA (cytosine1962-C5)-methyltransferase
MTSRAVVSRRGADRIRAGHPWIYRSDLVETDAGPGAIVRVTGERERPLGWAYFSSTSQIALRMVADAAHAPGSERALLAQRVLAADQYRQTLAINATAWRLVNGEADGLPATVVDRYGDDDGAYFVVQTLAQTSDRLLGTLVDVLIERWAPRGILARNDPKVRQLEGLESRVEVLHGDIPERIHVRENAVRYAVDLRGGQKTGLFLDQRENHAAAAQYSRGRALDAFTYNGGFALQMARRADRVLALDSSAAAVETTRANAAANGMDHVEVREANVFDELRELEIAGELFDTIALDPPAFARNRASVERAAAGYKEINLRALRILRPGGHLVTCSCSYNMGEDLFLEVLRAAAADARTGVWLVEKRMQARDHPILLNVPETYYLKCFVLRKVA